MIDRGNYVVKCVKAGGDVLRGHPFASGQEVDLLAQSTPGALRVASFWTAANMAADPSIDLAQKIANGEWTVMFTRPPRWTL